MEKQRADKVKIWSLLVIKGYMSQKSYQRLLQARLSALSRVGITRAVATDLDAALQMPQPQREEAFLNWCQSSKYLIPAKRVLASTREL
jgi:hypothetical protein